MNPLLTQRGDLNHKNGPIPIYILKITTYDYAHSYHGRLGYEWTYDVQNPDPTKQLALLIPITNPRPGKSYCNWMLHTPGRDPEYHNLSIPGHNSFTMEGHALTYYPLTTTAQRWIEQNSKSIRST